MEHVELIIYLVDKLQEFQFVGLVIACHRDAVMDALCFVEHLIHEFRAKDRAEYIQEAVESIVVKEPIVIIVHLPLVSLDHIMVVKLYALQQSDRLGFHVGSLELVNLVLEVIDFLLQILLLHCAVQDLPVDHIPLIFLIF